jgi:HSP20 family protein
MKLIKYEPMPMTPWADLDRLFGTTLGELSRWAGFPGWPGEGDIRVNVYQDAAAYHVVAELPGYSRDQIGLELENAVLTIRAERTQGEGDNARTWRVSRSLTIDEAVQADAVTAKLEHGLLTVTLPKAEDRKARQITVG